MAIAMTTLVTTWATRPTRPTTRSTSSVPRLATDRSDWIGSRVSATRLHIRQMVIIESINAICIRLIRLRLMSIKGKSDSTAIVNRSQCRLSCSESPIASEM